MTSRKAVGLAIFINWIVGLNLFILQPVRKCSTGPILADWIFFAGIVLLIRDADIFPKRYKHLSAAFQLIIETLMTLLVLEFSESILWCNIEKLSFDFMKKVLFSESFYYYLGGDTIVDYFLIIFSSVVFFNISLATGHSTEFVKIFQIIKNGINKVMNKVLGPHELNNTFAFRLKVNMNLGDNNNSYNNGLARSAPIPNNVNSIPNVSNTNMVQMPQDKCSNVETIRKSHRRRR